MLLNSTVMLILLLTLASFLLVLVLMALEIHRAPEAYQDSEGFHVTASRHRPEGQVVTGISHAPVTN